MSYRAPTRAFSPLTSGTLVCRQGRGRRERRVAACPRDHTALHLPHTPPRTHLPAAPREVNGCAVCLPLPWPLASLIPTRVVATRGGGWGGGSALAAVQACLCAPLSSYRSGIPPRCPDGGSPTRWHTSCAGSCIIFRATRRLVASSPPKVLPPPSLSSPGDSGGESPHLLCNLCSPPAVLRSPAEWAGRPPAGAHPVRDPLHHLAHSACFSPPR